jgi:hypothetical protein
MQLLHLAVNCSCTASRCYFKQWHCSRQYLWYCMSAQLDARILGACICSRVTTAAIPDNCQAWVTAGNGSGKDTGRMLPQAM